MKGPNNPIPTSCSALQNMLEELRWADRALKEIPNLPKGKLRDSLKESINVMIAGEADPERSETQVLPHHIIESYKKIQKYLEYLNKSHITQSEIVDLKSRFAILGQQLGVRN